MPGGIISSQVPTSPPQTITPAPTPPPTPAPEPAPISPPDIIVSGGSSNIIIGSQGVTTPAQTQDILIISPSQPVAPPPPPPPPTAPPSITQAVDIIDNQRTNALLTDSQIKAQELQVINAQKQGLITKSEAQKYIDQLEDYKDSRDTYIAQYNYVSGTPSERTKELMSQSEQPLKWTVDGKEYSSYSEALSASLNKPVTLVGDDGKPITDSSGKPIQFKSLDDAHRYIERSSEAYVNAMQNPSSLSGKIWKESANISDDEIASIFGIPYSPKGVKQIESILVGSAEDIVSIAWNPGTGRVNWRTLDESGLSPDKIVVGKATGFVAEEVGTYLASFGVGAAIGGASSIIGGIASNAPTAIAKAGMTITKAGSQLLNSPWGKTVLIGTLVVPETIKLMTIGKNESVSNAILQGAIDITALAGITKGIQYGSQIELFNKNLRNIKSTSALPDEAFTPLEPSSSSIKSSVQLGEVPENFIPTDVVPVEATGQRFVKQVKLDSGNWSESYVSVDDIATEAAKKTLNKVGGVDVSNGKWIYDENTGVLNFEPNDPTLAELSRGLNGKWSLNADTGKMYFIPDTAVTVIDSTTVGASSKFPQAELKLYTDANGNYYIDFGERTTKFANGRAAMQEYNKIKQMIQSGAGADIKSTSAFKESVSAEGTISVSASETAAESQAASSQYASRSALPNPYYSTPASAGPWGSPEAIIASGISLSAPGPAFYGALSAVLTSSSIRNVEPQILKYIPKLDSNIITVLPVISRISLDSITKPSSIPQLNIKNNINQVSDLTPKLETPPIDINKSIDITIPTLEHAPIIDQISPPITEPVIEEITIPEPVIPAPTIPTPGEPTPPQPPIIIIPKKSKSEYEASAKKKSEFKKPQSFRVDFKYAKGSESVKVEAKSFPAAHTIALERRKIKLTAEETQIRRL